MADQLNGMVSLTTSLTSSGTFSRLVFFASARTRRVTSLARLPSSIIHSTERHAASTSGVPRKCAELHESSACRHFPYVGCGRLSAERLVRATREGRQSGNGSQIEKAGISIPSVLPLGTEGQNRTSGHPNAKIECQAFTRDLGGMNISIWIDDALSVWPVLNER